MLTITQGKAKYNKWKEVVDAGMTKKEAEDKYIELGNKLVDTYDK
jgi:diazepam-binding inhibitor (GABA receptor modulating acyl-CoA-binding protein)